MKIYAAQRLPVGSNNLIIEHGLGGGIHGVESPCFHYRVDDEVGRFWIRCGLAYELKHRFDCATKPPPGANVGKNKKVY